MALRLGLKRFISPKAGFTRSLQHAADRVQVRIPEEMDLNLKWSLVDENVQAKGMLLANLDWVKLKQMARKAKLPEKPTGQPIALQRVEETKHHEFQQVLDKVTTYLSNQKRLFTCDGALGAAQDASTRVRVITDSIVVSMFAKAILRTVRVGKYREARPIVLYVATEGEFKDKPPHAISFLETDGNGVVHAKVVVTGAADLTALKDALAAVAKEVARNSHSLVLAADLVHPKRGHKVALVFNSSSALRAVGVASGEVIGAHLSVWSPTGVSPLFGGAIVDGSKRPDPDASVHLENGIAVPLKSSKRVVVQNPVAAVFVDKSIADSGLRPLKASEASLLLKKIDASVDTSKFEEYLKVPMPKSNAKAFAVANEDDIRGVFSKA